MSEYHIKRLPLGIWSRIKYWIYGIIRRGKGTFITVKMFPERIQRTFEVFESSHNGSIFLRDEHGEWMLLASHQRKSLVEFIRETRICEGLRYNNTTKNNLGAGLILGNGGWHLMSMESGMDQLRVVWHRRYHMQRLEEDFAKIRARDRDLQELLHELDKQPSFRRIYAQVLGINPPQDGMSAELQAKFDAFRVKWGVRAE